jgi:hypothetical protein
LKLSKEDQEFWERVVEPKVSLFVSAYYWITCPLLAEFLSGPSTDSAPSDHIRSAFHFSLKHAENDVQEWIDDGAQSEDAFDDYDFEGASEIVQWPMFAPDVWHQNAGELRGLLLTDDGPLPRTISRVLSEVNRAFVLGQYLACVAMARAALQYAIVSRAAAGALKVDTSDPLRADRTASLDLLIDRLRVAMPSIDTEACDYIRRAGNDVLHDLLKQDHMARIPQARARALRCVKNLRAAIEALY